MIKLKLESDFKKKINVKKNTGERGAALAITVIVVVILAVVGLTALAFSSSEVRIAGSDLNACRLFMPPPPQSKR
jgi:Tfp pilus assembly protein PilX